MSWSFSISQQKVYILTQKQSQIMYLLINVTKTKESLPRATHYLPEVFIQLVHILPVRGLLTLYPRSFCIRGPLQ